MSVAAVRARTWTPDAGILAAAPAVPIAAALGTLAGWRAVPTLLGIAVAAVGVVLMLRVELAVLVFVVVEPFQSYLKAIGGSAVKLLGALVFAAWLLRALSRQRTVRLRHPAVRAAAVLFGVLLAATVLHPNGAAGAQVLVRYLSYLGVFVVLVDCLQDGLPARRVATWYVTSCSVAAVVGLVMFARAQLRAGGPVGDPNDFAFFLLSATPLALGLRERARRPAGYALAAALMSAALLATLSRGALVGAAAALGYGVLAGAVRLRAVLAGVAVVALGSVVVLVGLHSRVTTSLHAKDTVAQQNVDDRLTLWGAAARMTAADPVLGLGPGGFQENRDRYLDYQLFDPANQLDVAHETYLETSAELGLPGLGALAALIGLAFAGARRAAARAGPDRGRADRGLAIGVCAATLGTAVAAAFLTEQYFLPLWLLAALGAALDPAGGASAAPADARSTTEGTPLP